MTTTDNRAWVVSFSRQFFETIYHYDAKRTFLVGTKDYNLYRDIIKLFIEGIKSDDLDKAKKELQIVKDSVSKNYLLALLDAYRDKYQSNDFNELIDLADEEKYIDAISSIEKKFSFSFSDKVKEYYDDYSDDYNPEDVSKNSLEHLKKVFSDYLEAQNLLFDFCDKYSSTIQNDVNGFQDDEDYIMIVVYSEFWNFLSHFSFANSYRTTINNYDKNIERSARHLERAILDIYKYVLIKGNHVDTDVLSIRVDELLSFGDSPKLTCTYQSYKDVLVKKLKI